MNQPIRTLCDLFRAAVAHDKPDCLLEKSGGTFRPVASAELATRVRSLAGALSAWGIRPGDRVAQMAENGVHWPTIDFAALALGAAHVPIYPTLHAEGAAHVLADSGSRVLFVRGRERLEGLLAIRDRIPTVERFVLVGDEESPEGIETLEQALAAGAATTQAQLESWLDRARPDDLATLIYTSGTTGDPKGVMLTHDNLTSNVVSCCSILPMKPHWVALSFLPLAHSFERTIDYVYFYAGVSIAYAESVQKVADNLAEVRPHVLGSVPRVYEKVRERALETATGGGALKRRIFDWAVRTGLRELPSRLAFEEPGVRLRIADALVFRKLRARFGGRFEYAVSGGGPLGKELAEFFWAAGIPLLEGYGLTETSPVIAVNTPQQIRLGTVGRPIPGVEVRIAADGEILARGPNIMKGYFGQPEATAEVLDADGWFRTGDIGELDADGFLSITDRKKELIVNAYGKNIAPAPIEAALKAGHWIAQAVVVGDRRPFLAALLVPDFAHLAAWAAAHAVGGELEAQLADPRVVALFQEELDRVNAGLERYEQVRAFALLPAELTLEGGELTPTLKLKRRVILERYGRVLDGLYSRTAKPTREES